MEPLTLATLTGAVLTQGITFLYSQAGEILRGWRERRAGADPGAVAPVAPPSVVASPLNPAVPDWAAVEALEADLSAGRVEGRVDVGTVHEGGQVVGVDIDRVDADGRSEWHIRPHRSVPHSTAP